MSTTAARGEDAFQRALTLHQQGRLEEADSLYAELLQRQPAHLQALHLSGIIALQMNRPRRALALFGEALRVDPRCVPLLVNQGNALQQLAQHEPAMRSFDAALALDPHLAEAHFNRGNALRDLGRYTEAVAGYQAALALKPAYADAHINHGLSLARLGRHGEALASYERAIALRGDCADAHYNRGNELRELGRFEDAVGAYDRALAIAPGFADAHLNRGTVLVELRRHSDALASFERAIALRPNDAEGYFNRGAALQYIGDFEAALACYGTALAINPDHDGALGNRAGALRELEQLEAALASYDRAIACRPDRIDLHADRLHTRMQACDWRDLASDAARVAARIESRAAANPFGILAWCGSAALQRSAAENWVEGKFPAMPAPGPVAKGPRPQRVRLGYFSSDLHEHATAYLIAELLELHDRSRFEVTAFSFGPDSMGRMRRRLQAACEHFVDVSGQSDEAVALMARNSSIDIAVDLKGFTRDARMGIFARRAAPLQVSYLGWPGTTGAPYMDYLIADSTLVPQGNQASFCEKIVYLPHSYQVNDRKRVIADRQFDRAALGLPPTGLVFCCFNNSYKITPAVLDLWMRILRRVDGSVLWLVEHSALAARNLRREAALRAVDPGRLIFAPRMDLPLHLARQRAADLFLDTFPCNAHTTASDALWAGLPLLTCPGEPFAARVAASLLSAIDLPELIAATPLEYEEIAVRLAADPSALAGIRQKLARNRLAAPLFDTPRYARHLEAAYLKMYERHRSGLPPADLQVECEA